MEVAKAMFVQAVETCELGNHVDDAFEVLVVDVSRQEELWSASGLACLERL